ncbi:MAG TPA: HNH endonuclease family protein, partial [Acidimicrobiia bacterium]|nr:HNH endonuclease family protein [Acidimicrobiia bacterium]
ASDVDIDHVVPLAEAWDSGARRWNAETRKRFANDLGDPRSLVAVTDNVNQSKSDQDPAEWLPERRTCSYVRQWVAVKLRWSLDVNRPEKAALKHRASDCKNAVLRVRRARVVKQPNDGGDGGGDGNCAPGYSPCVPPPPPDLDCADLDGPIYVTGSDPHHLDADGDGVGCE